MGSTRALAFFLSAVLCASVNVLAAEEKKLLSPEEQKAEDLKLRTALEALIAEIEADPQRYQQAMTDGRERAAVCKYCHGADGNAVKEGTPSIAGQNPVYIVDQFQRYGDGHRYDPWMANLAKTFSQEDKIKLAIYFSQQTMKPMGGGEPALRERGKEVFREYCMECHGEDGRGKEGYARLA